MTYDLQWLDKGLYRRFSGAIDGEEIANSNLQLHGDPRFDELQFIIDDFSGIDAIDLADGDLSLIANINKVGEVHSRDVKIAVVLDHPKRMEWYNQYFQEMGPASCDIQLFDDKPAAQQWLGI